MKRGMMKLYGVRCRKLDLFTLLCLSVLLAACGGSDELDFGSDETILDEEVNGETAVANPPVQESLADPSAIMTTAADFSPAACPFDLPTGFEIECGYLTVPENRTLPDSPEILLAVAIVAAQRGSATQAPLIYLSGGPGGSALDDFAADPGGWNYPFLQTRDLILLDQRGTGHSQPTLDCPEFQTADGRENPDQLCYDRLIADGIDLAAYNTGENAADVAALRVALGIEAWDILGISYGTRLALEMMRHHPDGVRAVILDSVFPPNADTPVDEVYSFTDALAELFADCASDSYCQETYPNLEATFLATVQRLNEDALADIFGDDLVFALSAAFSDTELIPLLPYVIYEVSEGNYDALDEIAALEGASRQGYQSDGADFSDSEGMYNSVICYDEYASGDYERVEDTVVGTIPVELEGALLQSTFDLTQLCSFWSPRDVVDNTAVSSSIPTLILSGQYDVATPPRWANLAAQTLGNSYLFVFPGAGHSLLSGVECAISISATFLDNPEQALNGACISDIEWPYFE